MADEIHVKGLTDLQKFLDELTPKMEKNIMRGGMRAGMAVVKPAAQANVHSVSGELARGLKISTNVKGGVVIASLKAKGPHGTLGHLVEYGTAAHYISVEEGERAINTRLSAKLGRIVRAGMRTVNRNSLKIGANFVGPTVFHPGARPRPFMRPALDQEAMSAVIAVGEYIKNRLATKHGLDTADITIGDEE